MKKEHTPSKNLIAMIKSYFSNMSERKRIAKSEVNDRRRLLGQMHDERFSELTVSIRIDGKPITLECKVDTAETTVINVKKLRRLVDDRIFMKCISATVKDVVEHAGAEIAASCIDKKEGEENVTVKPLKGKS